MSRSCWRGLIAEPVACLDTNQVNGSFQDIAALAARLLHGRSPQGKMIVGQEITEPREPQLPAPIR